MSITGRAECIDPAPAGNRVPRMGQVRSGAPPSPGAQTVDRGAPARL